MGQIKLAELQDSDTSRQELLDLHFKGDWRGVVDFLSCGEHRPLLLWLRPDLALFEFIAKTLSRHAINQLISLGCGTGLFEWMIQSAIPDIRLTGVEVDRNWWTSPYAPPVFHPLSYPEEPEVQSSLKDTKTALLFCYFNCEPAWREYLVNFEGPLVIVCGPVEGCGTHSDPKPFQSLTPEWTVIDGAKIGDTHDAIAVYARV